MTTPDFTNIIKKATECTLSYGKAMELSLLPETTRLACAKALASHYLPNHVAFFGGGQNNRMLPDPIPEDPDSAIAALIERHLHNFDKAGFGWKIKQVKYEVLPLSPESAQCWITWRIVDLPGGKEGWEWTKIYGCRVVGEEGEGKWEYSVSDNEIGELLKREPGFLEL